MNDLAESRAFAQDLLAAMALAEKAGQIAQIEKNSITPDEAAEFAIGSVLSGGGGNPDPNTPQTWRAMAGSYLEAGRRSRRGVARGLGFRSSMDPMLSMVTTTSSAPRSSPTALG